MTQMTRQVYGVSVDTDGFSPFAKQGSTLIVSQEEDPVSGDEVFIRIILQSGPLHMIKTYITTDAERGVAIVANIDGSDRHELQLDRIEVLDPIISVERPAVNRPIRLRPEGAVAV